MHVHERRKRFVQEYLVERNAAQAAIRAGHSRRCARQTGHRLLTDADVARQVEQRSREVAEKLEVDHELVSQGPAGGR